MRRAHDGTLVAAPDAPPGPVPDVRIGVLDGGRTLDVRVDGVP